MKLATFVKDSYHEMVDKVSWPKWETLQQSTMIVLVSTLILTGIVWIMDFISNGAMQFIYSLFK
jgi:preprotein translocase subunit SecE